MTDINSILIEGMTAIRGLLEGRMAKPNASAAHQISDAMHNLQPNPMMLSRVAEDLERFRVENPDVAARWLPQTFAWLDSKKGADS